MFDKESRLTLRRVGRRLWRVGRRLYIAHTHAPIVEELGLESANYSSESVDSNADHPKIGMWVLVKSKEWSNTCVCRLLWQVLTKNNFQFNGKNYLQVSGTAMGTRVTPTYANLFMADFEEVSFLDLRISLQGDDTLKTSLFVKPTDSGSYLHVESANPRHCIRGIQFLRISRICSDKEEFFNHRSRRVNTSCPIDTRSLSWGWLSLKPITGTNSFS